MDAENPMKLALMLSGDAMEHANLSGCWATCHHDLNSMPDAANDQAKKYLAVKSYTDLQIKPEDGKKRGGFDKRKDDTAIQAELTAGHYMDLLRFASCNFKNYVCFQREFSLKNDLYNGFSKILVFLSKEILGLY